MAVITAGALGKALWPGVNKFYGLGYKEHPVLADQIFEVLKSEKGVEEDVNSNGLGLAVVKADGADTLFDTMSVAHLKRYEMVEYALGFVISQVAIEDNQYPELIAKMGKRLGMSMRQTREVVAAAVLNRAFDSAYTGGDGLELLSTAHINSKGGTYSNELATAADLSEQALEQIFINIADATDDAGLKIALRPMQLIVPTALMFEAERLIKSNLRVDTANNDVNALKEMSMLPKGKLVNPHLTDADAWFVKTDCMDGLKLFDRISPEMKNEVEFNNDNHRFKARARFVAGWTDPKGLYGSPGA